VIPASQAVTDTIRSFDTARLVVLIAILVRRSMERTGRWAASNIGQAYSYSSGPSYYYTKWGRSIGRRSEDAGAH
jgi:hypothetical protein